MRVGGRQRLERVQAPDRSRRQRLVDHRRDVQERESPLQEGVHRHLVRRVQRARSRAAGGAGFARERQTRERLEIRRFERQ